MRPKYNLLKHKFNNPLYDLIVTGDLSDLSDDDVRYITQKLVRSLGYRRSVGQNYYSHE